MRASTVFVFFAGLAALSPVRAAESFDRMGTFTRMDSLFLTASTGEPHFQTLRDSCEKALVALDTATLVWLTDTASTPDHRLTPRQNHYVERLFTLVADSGRNDAARGILARAVTATRSDSVRARWLYIGSRIGDTAFRTVALPWLTSESETVRRMAVRNLGAYPDGAQGAQGDNAKILWNGLDAVTGLELHMRLWALGEQDVHHASADRAQTLRTLKRLAPLLRDEQIYNRQKVRDLMLKAADSAWLRLQPLSPQQPDIALRREWWRLAQDAKGGRPFLKSQRSLMTPEERVFYGVEAL